MEKKVKLCAKIIILLFLLFYTEKRDFGNAYQDMLFTHENKVDRNNDKFGGFTFKFGGNTEEIESWERTRMGYPFQAITIDRLEKEKITQGIIQYDYIFINLILGLVFYIILIIIFQLSLMVF